ncbi:unnamed protein product [Penicillium pancosmium]
MHEPTITGRSKPSANQKCSRQNTRDLHLKLCTARFSQKEILKALTFTPDEIANSTINKNTSTIRPAEHPPWVLALDGVECRICGHSIKLQYAAEEPKGPGGWRGYAQELQLASQQPGPQSLVPTELCYSTFRGETRTMHAACWKTIESIWKSEFTTAELDGFLDVSLDLAPFLPEIPYNVSPIEIDAGLTTGRPERPSRQNSIMTLASDEPFGTLETEGFQKPRLPDIKNHSLPPDLGRHNPTLGYWSSVARILETHPRFSNIPPAGMEGDITQILKSLGEGELCCFPHLVNYDIVYANAMTIILTLLKLPLQGIQGEPDLNGRRARLQLSRDINLPPALDTPAKLKLKFLTLRRKVATEGRPDRSDLRVGMKYLRDIWFGPPDVEIAVEPDDVVMVVPSFAGLRFFRDHVGVFVVLVKERETWHSCWQQHSAIRWQEGIPGAESTAVEWQTGVGQPSFLIVADTYRDMMLLDLSQNNIQKEKGSQRDRLKRMFKFSRN